MAKIIKLFDLPLTASKNKLECLLFASIESLLEHLQVRKEPT
jgi:hypothetical protein